MSVSLRYNIQANKTDGRLAQLVEHLLDVQVVSGSIPLASTNKKDPIILIGSFLLCALSDEKRLRKAAKAKPRRLFIAVILSCCTCFPQNLIDRITAQRLRFR